MSLKNKFSFVSKAISLIMAVSMLMAITVNATAYLTDDALVNTISSLELMPYTEDINAEGVVTREQMVISVLKFMGLDSSIPKEASKYTFDDVDYSKSYSAYVEFAYDMKLVSGVSETEFKPDNAATLPQAVKLLVSALGYDVVAERRGGYAAGYLSVASQQGLLKGIDMDNGDELTYIAFAKLLYNGLDIPIFEIDSYGEDVKYSESTSTVIVDKLEYKSIKGVIEETEDVNIYGNAVTAGKNQIYVGNKRFFDNNSGIKDFLGYSAQVYYKDADDEIPEIAFFVMDEKYNDTLSLSSEDISGISWDNGNVSILYFDENEHKRTENVSAKAYLYNGYNIDALQMEKTVIPRISAKKDWNITLIDNDADGSYDVMKIEDYISYLVKRVNSYSKLIYYYDYAAPELPKYIDFNITDDESDYSIFAPDGNKIEFSELSPDTVISLYENLQKTHRIVKVSDKTVTGEITEVDSEGKCVIDSKEYDVADGLKDKMLGEKGVFYLDIYGKIVGKKSTETENGGYGLLMDVDVPDIKLLSNNPVMRILTTEGELKDFQVENEIMAYNPTTKKFQKTDFRSLINTSPTPSGYDRIKDYMIWHTQNQAGFTFDSRHSDYTKEFYYRPWLSDKDKSDIASRKPIYYKLNNDGKISTVIVPNIPVKENKLTLLNDDGRYSFTYNSSAGMVLDTGAANSGDVPHYRIAKDATVFSVLALDYSLQDYSVPRAGISIVPNSAKRKMKLYSLNETDKEASLVVSYAYVPYEDTRDLQYVVVDRVSRGADDKITLYGFSQGQEYKSVVKNDTRLVEKIYNSSNTEYNSETKITAKNILDYRGYAFGGSGAAPYDIATSNQRELLEHPALKIGSNNPYVDETSLKRGDIVAVGKDRTSEICYVEVAMRASDGVMLIPQTADKWYGRWNNSRSYFKGVVTSVSGEEEVYLRIVGEYSGSNQRGTTPGPNYRAAAFFDDRNVPYDFTACKYVWIYDYERNRIQVIDGYSIEPGDVIVGRGTGIAPNDCIILKNYPSEPDFSYWQ